MQRWHASQTRFAIRSAVRNLSSASSRLNWASVTFSGMRRGGNRHHIHHTSRSISGNVLNQYMSDIPYWLADTDCYLRSYLE